MTPVLVMRGIRRRFALSSSVVVTAGVVAVALGASAPAARPSVATDQGIAYLAIQGEQGTIYRIGADGRGREPIMSGVHKWWGFDWSPDGEQIAFTRAQGGISVVSADGTNVHAVPGLSSARFRDAGDSTWSPDGSRIAFAAKFGDAQIYTARLDGTGIRRLTGEGRNYYPDWSPDGRWILFERHERSRGGMSDLMAIHPNGSGLRRIAAIVTGGQCLCADWSPDGSKITYQGTLDRQSSRPEIFVMNANGSGRTRLTRNNSRDENPDWSPDGTRIAFYSERFGNGEILVITADGARVVRVTRDPWYAAFPRWQPKV
jgi:Tol biopolymer transport system component